MAVWRGDAPRDHDEANVEKNLELQRVTMQRGREGDGKRGRAITALVASKKNMAVAAEQTANEKKKSVKPAPGHEARMHGDKKQNEHQI